MRRCATRKGMTVFAGRGSWRCVAFLLLACAGAWTAQDKREGSAASGSREVVREVRRTPPSQDWDIREVESRAIHRNREQEKTFLERREAAVRAFREASAPGAGEEIRIVLNEFGLPRSFWREQGALSAPSQKAPEEIAREFLRAHSAILPFSPEEIENLSLTGKHQAGGLTYLRFHQTVNGIRVFQGQVRITLNRAGQVVEAGVGSVIPQASLGRGMRLSPEEAVRAAYRTLGLEPPLALTFSEQGDGGRMLFRNPKGGDYNPIMVEATVFPMTAVEARLAYRVLLEIDGKNYYEILVDAEEGRLLLRHNLYRSAATGRVWKESPLKGPRELVVFPSGWLPSSGVVTTGNNVDAYLDVDGDNRPDPGAAPGIQSGRAFSAAQQFDFPAGDGLTGQDPRNFKAASVTNLFYFANVAHDYFYELGFTEAAGNFQEDNFGRGGLGNDSVRAEAQDPEEEDNSSFLTPPDGQRPRMQIGLWTLGTRRTSDDLDGAYSGQTVFHEYSHGVTDRLVGGPADVSCLMGTQSWAMAEGWSDYFGNSFFNDPVQDAYLSGDSVQGMRRHSYEGYPFTYEDLGNEGFEVHLDGEIWAAALWDLRKALGVAVTDRLVVSALKLTPCSATMIDARDAILTADRNINGGANRTRIWQVFARHGMGYSASGVDGDEWRGTVFTAAYDQPPDLQPGNRSPIVTSVPPGPPAMGGLYSYRVIASDPDGSYLRYELTEGPPGMMIDPVSGLIQWTAGFTGQRVKVTVSDAQGAKVVHGFSVVVDTPLRPGVPLSISGSKWSRGLASVTVPPNTQVLQVTLRGGSGDADLYLTDPDGDWYGRSLRFGNAETLTVAAPRAGEWRIEVQGYKDYAGVSLTASFPTPILVPANTTRSNLSGEEGSETFYRVAVPAGTTSLRISTRGGSGDVDLYVKRNQVPVCQTDEWVWVPCVYDLRSATNGNSEAVTVSFPQAGDWYINLSAFRSYDGVTLTVMVVGTPTLSVSPSSMAFVGVTGGTGPPPQTLAITNLGGGAYSWTAAVATASGGNWLGLGQTSGSGDANVQVLVVTAGMVAGTYRGTITVSASGLAGSPQTIQATLDLSAGAVIAVGPAALSFSAMRGQDAAPQTLSLSNAGGGILSWSATASTSSGGNWLVVEPASGSGNATLRVSVRAASLPDGDYRGAITITAAGATNSPMVVAVSLTITWPVLLPAEGIVNAASFARSYPIAPGEFVSLFGSNFTEPCSLAGGATNPCPMAQGFPLPTQLGSTRVLFNGIAAPLQLVTPNQINAVVPFELSWSPVTVVVIRGTTSSLPVRVPLASQAMGILTVLGNGQGAGIVLHSDFRLVSRSAPVESDEVVVIYCLGMGPVSPPVPSGMPPGSTLSETTIPMRVFFDGSQGRILFSGLAPGWAGLYQMNLQAPSFLARRYPLVVVQSEQATSNEISAGGPSLLDVTPNTVKPGSDASVVLRGLNLPAWAALRVQGEDIPAVVTDGPLETLTATIPARLLGSAGELALTVVDPNAPGEAPSNAVLLAVKP